MDYLTVRETAETWNLSLRTVQQLCAQGRIPGAKKFGKFWAIPAGAAKPQVSQQDQLLAEGPSAPGGQLDAANLMPLMNTPFLPGRCRAAVEAMAPGPRRDIALAEYHYFTGHPEEAAQEAQPYLDSDDVGARLSACLVYAYANLSIGEICRAKFALGELSTSLAAAGERSPQFQAASAFVAAAGAVLLHLPLPEGLPWRVGYFLLSYLLICLGIALSNHCGLPIIPTDLFPREVAAITGLPYARVKIGFDASCLAGTVVLTLCCLGQVEGLGIGTVAAALTMGKVIGWMGQGVARHLRFRPRAVPHRRLRQA